MLKFEQNSVQRNSVTRNSAVLSNLNYSCAGERRGSKTSTIKITVYAAAKDSRTPNSIPINLFLERAVL